MRGQSRRSSVGFWSLLGLASLACDAPSERDDPCAVVRCARGELCSGGVCIGPDAWVPDDAAAGLGDDAASDGATACDGAIDGGSSLVISSSFDTDPVEEGWVLRNARHDPANGWVVLTDAVSHQKGALVFDSPQTRSAFTAEFSIWIGGGEDMDAFGGGDGIAFVFGVPTSDFEGGATGNGLGAAGLGGWAVRFDTFPSGATYETEPRADYVSLCRTVERADLKPARVCGEAARTEALAVASDLLTPLDCDSDADSDCWHPIRIDVDRGRVVVSVDEMIAIDHAVEDWEPFDGGWYLGFTAATGSRNNVHRIDDITIERGEEGCP